MSKVLVINEPYVPDFCRTQRWAARTRGRALRAPDWLAYATAVLKKEGIDTRLYDFPAKDWGKEKLTEVVKEHGAEIVVLDATTPSIYSDIECAQLCKDAGAKKIIMVGPHVTTLPEETLKIAEGKVDAIARGEYDYTVRDIVKKFLANESLEDVLGVTYIDDKLEVHHNADRPLIENLDELPFPAWEDIDLGDYFDGTKLFPYVDMIGGRGCPFQCIFCLWPQVMHGNQYRLRSPKNIVDEIEHDIEIYPKVRKGEFFFEDDTFTVNVERAFAICEEIKKRNLKINWSVNSRGDFANLELFKAMKDAGCRLVLVGFESGSDIMLKNMHKNNTVAKMKEFVNVARQAKLKIHGCFVLGLPGETEQTMQETLDFSKEVKLDTLQFSAAVPFPGTKYFRYCEENDLLNTKKWSDWLNDGEQGAIIDYPGLSKEIVESYVNKGLKQFYFRPSYIVKFMLDTRSMSDFYRKLRGAKNFMKFLLGMK